MPAVKRNKHNVSVTLDPMQFASRRPFPTRCSSLAHAMMPVLRYFTRGKDGLQ